MFSNNSSRPQQLLRNRYSAHRPPAGDFERNRLLTTVGKNRLRLPDSSVEPLMKTMIPLFLVALASVATLGAKSGAAKPAVVETTVCDLVKRSIHFDKADVRVRAIVMSDLIEHTMLVDDECPARGISLWIPHELDDSTDVRALLSELRSQWALATDLEARKKIAQQIQIAATEDVIYIPWGVWKTPSAMRTSLKNMLKVPDSIVFWNVEKD